MSVLDSQNQMTQTVIGAEKKKSPPSSRIRYQTVFFQMIAVFLVITLESLEALQWNPGRSCDKLQKSGSTLLIKRFHSFPKPLHNVAVWCAMFESSVGLPVIYVNFTQATHDELHVEKRGQCETHVAYVYKIIHGTKS